MSDAFRLVVVLLLIGGNAIFVAAEYALVTARRTRLEERAHAGSRRARTALKLMDEPVRFIGAIQDVSRIESATGKALGACPPPELTTIDFLRSFTKYARTPRQELHLPAGVVAVKAIASSFPCT